MPRKNLADSSREAKKILQAAIDDGTITTKPQLLACISENGWRITRNGQNYVGVLHRDGTRFRLRFEFGRLSNAQFSPAVLTELSQATMRSELRRNTVRNYWFYALLAHSEDQQQKVCYVGQTINLSRRLKEHIKVQGHLLGRSSSGLFKWAAQRSVDVRWVVLSQEKTTQRMALRFVSIRTNSTTDSHSKVAMQSHFKTTTNSHAKSTRSVERE